MLRGFTDSTGVEWRVWAVFPGRASEPSSSVDALTRSSLKETPYANGWLCFESKDAKRRLAPIPKGWEFSTEKLLAGLCEQATAATRRHGRFGAEFAASAEAEAPGAG